MIETMRMRENTALAIALMLVVIALAACESGGSDAAPKPRSGPNVEVFMETTATADDVEAVRKQLRRSDDVTSIRFVSREDAYRRFSKWFAKQPELLANTTPEQLPESFKFSVSGDTRQLAARLKKLQGVDAVMMPPAARPFCRRLNEATRDMSRADRRKLAITGCQLR